MNKLLLTILITLAGTISYGQFSRGTLMLGGSGSLEFSTNKDKGDGITVENYKTTSFSLSPQIGVFVTDALAIGGGMSFNSTVFKNRADNRTTNTSISIDPFIRYYLPQRLFFEGKFMIGTGTINSPNDKWSYSLTGWSLSAGYSIALNESIAIEPQLGYGLSAFKPEDDNVKEIDAGLFLRIGFQVYLPR
jgi:hypothetical protein